MGKPWTREEMQAAIEEGPHMLDVVPEVMAELALEIEDTVRQGQAKVVLWEDIKEDPPEELTVSPTAMIPHKSRKFHAILDLSFATMLLDGSMLAAVNESSEKTVPRGATDQLGFSLSRIIHAFAQAGPDDKVFMAKWDIKDGFWRLDYEEGEE